MSAGAASAAVLEHPRVDFADNSVGGLRLPGQRNVLRSVPASGKPDGDGPEDPLRLGRRMRLRLLAAVQALLADPSIAGLKDAPKLAAVVLYAKSRAPKGRENDLLTSIWVAELGRWMGVGESTVDRNVLAPMRKSDALHTKVVRDGLGHPTGLECLVMPLWNAHHGGGAGHPLALTAAELATLLRLIEALFGHGWTPENKEATPPGLLAARRGRGAATDRLGLLLMVLNTGSSGWLQLCGGSVKKREGRGAATMARLLGCSPAGGRKVLARLTDAGVAARGRKGTGTGMDGRGRVMVLPVARAYGRDLADAEAAQGSETVFSARPAGAGGDHAPAVEAGALGAPGESEAETASEAEIPARPAGAELHTVHAHMVTPVVPLQLDCGFSGEGRGAEGRRPERVCAGEDQAVDGQAAVAATGSPVAGVGPLRGEKPKKSPVDERVGQRAAGAGAGGRPKAAGWEKAKQQRRVGLPADLPLRVALGPVEWLWKQLNGWQQDQVEAAAKAELAQLAGLGVAPEGAPRLLADRLTSRLEETGGEALVDKPYGWLIRRGLPQRPACSHRRCDDGIRLDTGEDCENCANVLHLRRSRQARIAAEVEAQLPGLDDRERRRVLEERLREAAALEAEDLAWRQEQARSEQDRRTAARAEAMALAKAERQAAAAALRVLPCEDCGQEQAAGLCEVCGYRRRTEALTLEAGMVAAAASSDLDDSQAVSAVLVHVRETLQVAARKAQDDFLGSAKPGELDADPLGTASVLAFGALQAVQDAASEYHRCALEMLGRTEEAEAEARRAFRTEQGRHWFRHNPNGADAVAAATKAADTARERTAQLLLATRLDQLRQRAAARTEQAGPAPWTDRLPDLATRPLDGGATGAVIA
ncbi:hypothetical protein EES37_37935 [Streptomyces sp. ADI91-18]|uniref:hypothetical protein n=1 Tax=Streptomyces sp. ADI91-18 TaxID=1522755 RepID=UPI000FC30F1B|nr:hypothetical protein [Streptomyces sp. ADI91-18]RPK23540.1 hypothetical protein EES37_37935 [Streptomyces sp. ADI91-18]